MAKAMLNEKSFKSSKSLTNILEYLKHVLIALFLEF